MSGSKKQDPELRESFEALRSAAAQLAPNHWAWIVAAARERFAQSLSDAEAELVRHRHLADIPPPPRSGMLRTRADLAAETRGRIGEYHKILVALDAMRDVVARFNAVNLADEIASMLRARRGGA